MSSGASGGSIHRDSSQLVVPVWCQYVNLSTYDHLYTMDTVQVGGDLWLIFAYINSS